MHTMLLVPSKAGYSGQQGAEAASVALDSPAAAYRAVEARPAARVSASWQCSPADYQYLRALYRTGTSQGSLPFLAGLVLDGPELRAYVARFIPGSLRLASVQGLTLSVSAELEVTLMAGDDVDAGYYAALTAMYEAYGRYDAALIGLSLEELVEALPS